MYRLVFNPKSAAWNIQIQVFYVFWSTIKTSTELGTHDQAISYIKSIGLDKVYRNYRDAPQVGPYTPRGQFTIPYPPVELYQCQR